MARQHRQTRNAARHAGWPLLAVLPALALACFERDAPGHSDLTLTPARTAQAALHAELASVERALAEVAPAQRSTGLDAAAFVVAPALGAEAHLGAALAELQPDTVTVPQVAVRLELCARLHAELLRARELLAGATAAPDTRVRDALERAAASASGLRSALTELSEAVREEHPMLQGILVPSATEVHAVALAPGVSAGWTAVVQRGPVSARLDCGQRKSGVTLMRLVAGETGTFSGEAEAAFDALVDETLARISVHTPEWENPNAQDGTGPEIVPCVLTVVHPQLASAPPRLLGAAQLEALRASMADFDARASQAHAELEHLRGLALQDPSLPRSAALDELERALLRSRNALSVVPGLLARGEVPAEVLERVSEESASDEMEMIKLQSAISARGQALQLMANLAAAMNETSKNIVQKLGEHDRPDGGG